MEDIIMKRVIACLLSIILMLCFIPALAEDFTLHSGVKFGMNKEEVINVCRDTLPSASTTDYSRHGRQRQEMCARSNDMLSSARRHTAIRSFTGVKMQDQLCGLNLH